MIAELPLWWRDRRHSWLRRWLHACAEGAVVLGMTCASLPASAQSPDASGAEDRSNASPSEQAERLFIEGVRLRNWNRFERALSLFLESRALERSVENTYNAAFCLARLGRDDEALEMYAELLFYFLPDLDPAQQESIGLYMGELRKEVGSLDLSLYAEGQIFIDGRARGRLPLSKPLWVLGGRRVVRILAPDSEPLEVTVDVPIGETLFVNEPLLPKQPPSPRFMEAFGGYAGGGTLGGDAVNQCLESCAPDGFVVGARAGYRFSFGSSLQHSVALEITGGYLLLKSGFSRVIGSSFSQGSTRVDVFYNLADEPSVRGPFVGTGLSYRLKLGSHLETTARMTAGVLAARSANPITGTATTNEDEMGVRIVVSSQNEVLGSQPFFLMPALGMSAWLDDLYAGISLGIFIVPSKGPAFSHVETGVKSPACGSTGDAGCAPNSGVVAGESAYGPLWIWVPQIAVGHVF